MDSAETTQFCLLPEDIVVRVRYELATRNYEEGYVWIGSKCLQMKTFVQEYVHTRRVLILHTAT